MKLDRSRITTHACWTPGMGSSATDCRAPLTVVLHDGRRVSVPLNWYPRLTHGTLAERRAWRVVGQGEGIHWPRLDEDVSVAHLLQGIASGESAKSLDRWLSARTARS